MEALERFYNEYLMGYSQDSNCEGYDIDEQMTKDRIESILVAGYMTEGDNEFIRSILPDIENESIRADIAEYLERLVVI